MLGVPDADSKPDSASRADDRPVEREQSFSAHRRARKLEARGILLIVAVILLITLIRYWHNIPWGAR